MKKTIAFLILASFTISATALHSPEHEVKVEGEINQEDKNFYPDQKIVEFPSVKSGEETVRYSNASYREYVSWQVKDKGLNEIRSELKSELSLNGIRTGSTAESIEITYIENESIERNYTYEELQEKIPSRVEGSFEINGKTVNTTVDVKLKSKEDSPIQEELDYSIDRGGAFESLGSSSGEKYNTTFDILNTTQGEHPKQITNVEVEENSISFTGNIHLSQPCNKVNKTYEKKDSKLILKVGSYSTEEPCVDVVAFKEYRFELESNEPVRLEVRHNGEEVRTLNGLQARNLKNSGDETNESGVVAEILNFFQNLF